MQTSDKFITTLETLLKVEQNSISVRIFDNSSSTTFVLDEFLNHFNPESIAKGLCNFVFRIDYNQRLIASFNLRDMINCAGILVYSDLIVSEQYRNSGVGTEITKFVIDFSKNYGYGMILGTDISNNKPQIRIFEKLNWKELSTFINPKTKNLVTAWSYNIK